MNVTDLEYLGEDLIAAIENAAWVYNKKANLREPTPYMKNAIQAFRRYIGDFCPTCDQPRRKK